MLESSFKLEFLDEIQRIIPYDLYIYTTKVRSYPDTVVLGRRSRWAALEFKKSEEGAKQPNQEYHVSILDEMGYAAFVYPENREEVLDDLERLFSSG